MSLFGEACPACAMDGAPDVATYPVTGQESAEAIVPVACDGEGPNIFSKEES